MRAALGDVPGGPGAGRGFLCWGRRRAECSEPGVPVLPEEGLLWGGFALPGVGVGDAEARAETPDGPVLPQIPARAAVAERGGGVPAHVHPRLCHEGRVQRLHRVRGGCGALQPQERGGPQHHATSCPPDPVPVCPEHLDT